MRVKSVNIGEKKTVKWGNKTVSTGIFKYPVQEILLGSGDVENDAVVDRKYHGGPDKACYIYSADHYPFWNSLYPSLDWDFGMFGENITVEGLDERQLKIGDTYSVGEAIVQVSEPRQPCFKLNLRFNSNRMLKEFINFANCGAYLRVVQKGIVKPGDEFKLIESSTDQFSIRDVFKLMYKQIDDHELLKSVLNSPHQTAEVRNELMRVWGIE